LRSRRFDPLDAMTVYDLTEDEMSDDDLSWYLSHRTSILASQKVRDGEKSETSTNLSLKNSVDPVNFISPESSPSGKIGISRLTFTEKNKELQNVSAFFRGWKVVPRKPAETLRVARAFQDRGADWSNQLFMRAGF